MTMYSGDDVFDLEEGEQVGCYYCMRQNCHDSYGKGQAFLAGPGHSPCDGNANYICMDHLDNDAVLPSGKTAEEERKAAWKNQPVNQVSSQ